MSLYNPQYKDGQGNIVDLPINAKKLDGYTYNEYSKYYTTSSTTENAFLVTIPYVKALSDGLVIHCQFHTATNSGATLNVNSLGAKGIYYRYATAITTHIVAHNYVDLIYSATIDKWVLLYSYDANSNSLGYQVRTNNGVYKNGASTSCYRYQILVETNDGLEAFTSTNNSTGTSKAQLSPNYIPNGEIRYYSSTTTVTSGANFGATSLWQQYQGINLKYSFNISTITNNSPCYIKMSRNTDGTLKPVYSATSGGHPLVFALPTTKDGYYYTYLGRTYTSSNVVYLELELSHPTFYYDGGIMVYDGTYLYDWAKASTKPTYTASEVGALPSDTTYVKSASKNGNTLTITPSSGTALTYTPSIPTKTSDLENDRFVRYDTWDQDLTELQKIQARNNIGAGTSSFSGSYNDLTDKPDECVKTVPMYIEDGDDDRYIFLWGLKEDTHTLYFLPEGTYYVYARGTNLSDRDGYIGTFFGPATLTIHSMGSSELRYNLYDGYGQGIGYGSVHKYVSTITPDYYEYSPIVKANFEAQTGTPAHPLYIKYTSPTYTDGATYEFAECSLYAGGTNVTLNGTNKGSTTASFYAPTSGGTSGQFLKSSGNGAPSWETVTIPSKTSELTNDSGYTTNTGTVTSVRVQAGTGLTSSTSTASTTTLDTTISIASNYKLLTTTEYNTLNAKQSKISALGSTTKPVYFSSDGVASECSTYAGGTAITLNGTSKAASTASFYAPTSLGTNGQLLSSNGSSLVWTNDNRSLLHHDLGVIIENTTTDKGWGMFNSTINGFLLKSVRFQSQSPSWGVGDFGAGIVFGGADTKGVVSVAYGTPKIKIAGGNGTDPTTVPRWWIELTGTSTTSYDLDKLTYAPTSAGPSGHSLKSNGYGAPRWAYSREVQLGASISSGAKNCASVTFVITNGATDYRLNKGLWYYSGTYGVFIVYLVNSLTSPGSPKTEYISGYVSSSIPNNTKITLIEL